MTSFSFSSSCQLNNCYGLSRFRLELNKKIMFSHRVSSLLWYFSLQTETAMHYYQEQYVIMKATMPSDTNLPNILQTKYLHNDVHVRK